MKDFSVFLSLVAFMASPELFCGGFQVRPLLASISSFQSTLLMAKKKRSTGQGFGKTEEETEVIETEKPKPSPVKEAPAPFLSSVESGGSTNIPVQEDLPPEERAKKLLREKYGLKTLEEQQLDTKQLEQYKERQKKMSEWKKASDNGNDLDIMAMLPAPVLIAIDQFLKIGVVITGLLFIAAGLCITLEAWSKTSNQPLPPDIDTFVVNVVEPNFTTGLFVLLGFSVSLGLFAAAQLGSAGAQYKEDN